jgi:hypothetical protein
MTQFVALPLIVAIGVAVAGSGRLDRLRPATAARCSAVLLIAVLVAAAPTLWLIGLSGLAHLGVRNSIIQWCRHLLPGHGGFGAVIGICALVAAIIGTIRVARVLAHHSRVRCVDAGPIEYIATDEIYAYTLPGPARTIVISDGLRSALDRDEFDVVLAHERAHARHRHDRFKLLALVTKAFVPPSAPIASRLDFYLERWADEEAVDRTGTERRVAARTIAKVALAASSPHLALGVADHSTAARATALLDPVERTKISAGIHTAMVLAATLSFTVLQIHHSTLFAAGHGHGH